ncbi:hypothetical protein [Bacilliculturomica massiliensis]|uniref:hypothetical protein n=1 Tax=Bacilliculturomica massiliensis TaxID=1917867 RepID=UPI0010309AD8|nr:hypothetical protein [Bacilliculturomica massiliensis]
MIRYTKKRDDGKGYQLEKNLIQDCGGSYGGPAADRLARFENLYEQLLTRQDEIAVRLEELRAADKKSSVKFKELLGEKLMNNNTLILFKTFVED